MHRLISRLRAFFQRKADPKEAREERQKLLEDATSLQNKQGVVAGSCSNYDCMTKHTRSSADVETGDNPLKAEPNLPAAVEEQSPRGLNAVTLLAIINKAAMNIVEHVSIYTMEYYSAIKKNEFMKLLAKWMDLEGIILSEVDNDHDEEPSESHMRILLASITSLVGDADYNGHGFSFSLDIACKDFKPYNGDLVEIEFSDEQDTQSRRAILVKPLKHCHLNEVRVTRTDGSTGVLEDTIFFTLDSLKLPSGYVPQPDDVVNVVAVQSMQSNYFWRAVAMTPVQVL